MPIAKVSIRKEEVWTLWKGVKIQIVSSEVYAFQLYPVHTGWISSVSAKASAWGICYTNKRGCYVSRKDDRSGGNSLPSMVLATFKLCPVSSICSLQGGVPQPHQNRVCSLSTTLPCWSDSPHEYRKGCFCWRWELQRQCRVFWFPGLLVVWGKMQKITFDIILLYSPNLWTSAVKKVAVTQIKFIKATWRNKNKIDYLRSPCILFSTVAFQLEENIRPN